jgi:hypothetical protein
MADYAYKTLNVHNIGILTTAPCSASVPVLSRLSKLGRDHHPPEYQKATTSDWKSILLVQERRATGSMSVALTTRTSASHGRR